jgi:hypothetical protein
LLNRLALDDSALLRRLRLNRPLLQEPTIKNLSPILLGGKKLLGGHQRCKKGTQMNAKEYRAKRFVVDHLESQDSGKRRKILKGRRKFVGEPLLLTPISLINRCSICEQYRQS